jgi:predicted 3-demethylubiquinone-9 3-methyltransferase (glyoxalase superfamily)
MLKPTPFLWFEANAEDAAAFYLSLFPNSRKLNELRHGGKLVTIAIELNGQQMTFLNGGPVHKLTEAFSFSLLCETQAEIDEWWDKLGEGGQELACGWLRDRFGLCWQVVPANISKLLSHPAAMAAMMTMKKFDIAALEEAGKS